MIRERILSSPDLKGQIVKSVSLRKDAYKEAKAATQPN